LFIFSLQEKDMSEDPITLITDAEKNAEKAENLSAFSGLKLLHIKKQLSSLLGLIGRDGIFDEYTKHDISHVNEMLKMLDWLIPEDTKKIMSPADWLMSVLGIYFHDLGMLVTRHEFNTKEESDFPSFKERLFSEENTIDYRIKVAELNSDDSERFLYQEFVRSNHSTRIQDWIIGNNSKELGLATRQFNSIQELLKPLNESFRRDLAFVCASHHANDLNDLRKYGIRQPYGNSEEETANLQYAAILLRTADLLHITQDRTPSIIFKTICPSDPLSQSEWARQQAVTCVRSQYGKDIDGNFDPNSLRDTIEIFAEFSSEEGFFGLTSYLSYAKDEILKSHNWAKSANQGAAKHKFPWKRIDDTNIRTEGFIKESFEFTLDQKKILDLLTGHTLYNDTRVVLRELLQNAIDAVRFQLYLDKLKDATSQPGKIEVQWNSTDRMLTIKDTGTGMSQKILEDHFLRVGASRYQDIEFIKQYPNFSAISRFGIGVLSTFMIADSVEIITSHPDDKDADARRIALRSVHGKYLIQLLNRQTDEDARKVLPHGTLIRLKVRPSATMPDVLATAKGWVIIPRCEVTVKIDNSDPVRIGYESPRLALIDCLRNRGFNISDDEDKSAQKEIRVVEKKEEGIILAYALQWNRYFLDWQFMRANYSEERYFRENRAIPTFGICVEGILVDGNPPGFSYEGVMAIADCIGNIAPKTNVARSGLEITSERDTMLSSIYSIYSRHIYDEMNELHSKYNLSLTWAAQESQFLTSSLLSLGAIDRNILEDCISEIPIFLFEQSGQRKAASINDLKKISKFWTIDCQFLSHAEALMREISSDLSISCLLSLMEKDRFCLPEEPVLCGSNLNYDLLFSLISKAREIKAIILHKDLRRVDLCWGDIEGDPMWYAFQSNDVTKVRKIFEINNRRFRRSSSNEEFPLTMIPKSNFEIIGNQREAGVKFKKDIYLFPGTELWNYLSKIFPQCADMQTEVSAVMPIAVSMLLTMFLPRSEKTFTPEWISRYLNEECDVLPDLRQLLDKLIVTPEFCDILNAQGPIFDTSAWTRQE